MRFSGKSQVGYLSTSHSRLVWHLKAIRHMTCETNINNGSLDAIIGHYIYNMRYKIPCLPRESATWLKDNFKMRIAFMKIFYKRYK